MAHCAAEGGNQSRAEGRGCLQGHCLAAWLLGACCPMPWPAGWSSWKVLASPSLQSSPSSSSVHTTAWVRARAEHHCKSAEAKNLF